MEVWPVLYGASNEGARSRVTRWVDLILEGFTGLVQGHRAFTTKAPSWCQRRHGQTEIREVIRFDSELVVLKGSEDLNSPLNNGTLVLQ